MKRLEVFIILTSLALSIMAQQKITQTAGRDKLGDFAPEFAHLNDGILFGNRFLIPKKDFGKFSWDS